MIKDRHSVLEKSSTPERTKLNDTSTEQMVDTVENSPMLKLDTKGLQNLEKLKSRAAGADKSKVITFENVNRYKKLDNISDFHTKVFQ